MHVADAIAIFLVIGAAAAFGMGGYALSRSEDLKALYWLLVGILALRGAVQVGRPGAKA